MQRGFRARWCWVVVRFRNFVRALVYCDVCLGGSRGGAGVRCAVLHRDQYKIKSSFSVIVGVI